MLSCTFETASCCCKLAHLSHLRTILLITIPAPRINIMNSIVRPRRSTSCLTDKGGDSAASSISSRRRLSVSGSELNSSWFMLLDAAILSWDSLPAAAKEGNEPVVSSGHKCRANNDFFKKKIHLTSSHSFFPPFNLDSCSRHCLFIDNLDSCFFYAQNNKSMWSRNKLVFQVFPTLKGAVAESHNYFSNVRRKNKDSVWVQVLLKLAAVQVLACVF